MRYPDMKAAAEKLMSHVDAWESQSQFYKPAISAARSIRESSVGKDEVLLWPTMECGASQENILRFQRTVDSYCDEIDGVPMDKLMTNSESDFLSYMRSYAKNALELADIKISSGVLS